MIFMHHQRVDRYSTTSFSVTSLKDRKGNSSSVQKNSDQYTWVFTSLGKRNGKMCNYTVIHGLWSIIWLDALGLGRNIFGKLITRKFVEVVYGQISLNGHVFPVITYQGDIAEDEFNNQMNRISHTVDISQPLSSTTTVLTQCAHKQSVTGVSGGSHAWPQPHRFPFTRLTWLESPTECPDCQQ